MKTFHDTFTINGNCHDVQQLFREFAQAMQTSTPFVEITPGTFVSGIEEFNRPTGRLMGGTMRFEFEDAGEVTVLRITGRVSGLAAVTPFRRFLRQKGLFFEREVASHLNRRCEEAGIA